MPPQNNQNQPSPFEIVTTAKSKNGGSKGLLIAGLIVLFLILSVVAGVLLVQQKQNIQEKAASTTCPAAEQCPNSKDSNLLQSCHPADSDGTTTDSRCSTAGRVETCGPATTQYCCPAVGGAWTTDMTVCNSLANTPTPSPTPIPTITPSPTPVSTVTPTPTAVSTGAPNSCNGTCGSDSNCQSGYICSGGYCRNPLCTSATDCNCGTATTTPISTATPVPSATPRSIPVTGIDWPTTAGIGVGAAAIILSILIAL